MRSADAKTHTAPRPKGRHGILHAVDERVGDQVGELVRVAWEAGLTAHGHIVGTVDSP
jgi:hypothetical protein